MPAIRTISDKERLTLKRACDAAYDLIGGMSLFLSFTRGKVSQLSKYASDAEPNAETFMPLDIAIEADRRAKDPVITREMARMLGYRLVIDASSGRAAGTIEDADVHAFLLETHDLHRVILEAKRDGKVDSLDKQLIAKEAREAMREIQEILDMVEDH